MQVQPSRFGGHTWWIEVAMTKLEGPKLGDKATDLNETIKVLPCKPYSNHH